MVPPRYALRDDRIPGTTNSWRMWAERKEVEDWIQCVAGVLEQGWNDACVQILLSLNNNIKLMAI